MTFLVDAPPCNLTEKPLENVVGCPFDYNNARGASLFLRRAVSDACGVYRDCSRLLVGASVCCELYLPLERFSQYELVTHSTTLANTHNAPHCDGIPTAPITCYDLK